MNVTQESVVTLPDGRMNAKNAALYLGLSDKTLAMKRCDGKGPKYVKCGGKVFYFKSELDDWIASGEKISTQQMPNSTLAS
jgi:predicted DNA-binding transcriptional regulator AlpA